MFVRGALGKRGRKRAHRAQAFLGGKGGFLNASTVMAAVGVAWGIYESLQQPSGHAAPATGPATGGTAVPPPVPGTVAAAASADVPPAVARLVRLAASAANADGTLSEAERQAIVAEARRAGVAVPADEVLQARQPLADVVAGVTNDIERRDLYVLAFAIVRADEGVSGAERIYLAQLAHALGLDANTVAALERETAAAIDAAGPPPV